MTGPSEDTPAARYVGVGIGTYKETAYPPLPGAPVEVQEIAGLLGARGVRTTVAAATTETGLIAELRQMLPPQPEGGEGQLVVLWAGHGDRLPDDSLRLVAEDTAKDDAALLTAEYVAKVAVRSGATQVLLIFDTCFSGGGALPALAGADRWFSEREGPPGKVWLGVLASAMDWQKARDDLFGDRLARLLRDGPSRAESRLRGWSPQNEKIRGDDLIDALQKEWPDGSPHRPKAAQFGNPWALLPNPRHDPAAPPRVVEHLLHAARGGEPEDESWYFTDRRAVIGRLVSWMGSGRPGLRVVTGPAGCGKSAVLGLVVCLSHPEQRAALLARGPLGYPDPGRGLGARPRLRPRAGPRPAGPRAGHPAQRRRDAAGRAARPARRGRAGRRGRRQRHPPGDRGRRAGRGGGGGLAGRRGRAAPAGPARPGAGGHPRARRTRGRGQPGDPAATRPRRRGAAAGGGRRPRRRARLRDPPAPGRARARDGRSAGRRRGPGASRRPGGRGGAVPARPGDHRPAARQPGRYRPPRLAAAAEHQRGDGAGP